MNSDSGGTDSTQTAPTPKTFNLITVLGIGGLALVVGVAAGVVITKAVGDRRITGAAPVAQTTAEAPVTSQAPADPSSSVSSRPDEAGYGPGVYRVPEDIPRAIYQSSNVPGVWPGCMWTTYTKDGTPIDLYNQTFSDGTFEIPLLSPAIARFDTSEGCAPLIKVTP